MYKIQVQPRLLHFHQPAGTSRGVYTTRKVWYIRVSSPSHPEVWGVGECAPLPALSCDDLPGYEELLQQFCSEWVETGIIPYEKLRPYPSILFGMETALKQYEAQSFRLWDTPFSEGLQGIPINGLIWMQDYTHMLEQIKQKIASGFKCIKVKIGAIRFEEELALLRYIRQHFTASDIAIRVDANGAFTVEEAFTKLEQLAGLDIHSIEQPIRAGQWNEMAELVAMSPLPIALDEELIGINDPAGKRKLLETIRPHYIILKPSLHGGFLGGNEWIELAEANAVDWWITSALESNIGLNAIAQWCGTFSNPLPQGLGTGMLYTDNIPMPLAIRKDRLWFNPTGEMPAPFLFKSPAFTEKRGTFPEKSPEK
ncbi:MAG: o-succinylbenzoate synthase [Tannerellaceae bacterium]|nr:o-succinylbenzoate synthase [Tannerellaceae bacterium]